MELSERKKAHARIMRAICEVIRVENKPLVLKGGTALMLCYQIDRFSEDLDFDLLRELKTHLNLESICKDGLKKLNKQGEGIELSKFADLKMTDTTHRARALFKLPGEKMPVSVKLEISARQLPDPGVVKELSGIKVYNIDEIARLKLLAAQANPAMPYRTAARDLHDLAFIASEYENDLSDETISDLEVFFMDIEALMMRYADAYKVDSILNGRLYGDLDVIEKWNNSRGGNSNLSLFQP
ncbi:MAG TPA: nucleotidyl transferase AbiEii/AbiGii toxin family protein [Marinobacter sp.]|uniref:Nucleotidyl transferase AbiEii/AbiGii toxin family protein n=2 Tax=root TaxID=1 RepID=A0A831R5U5_9GAMM|nr:nucleotidyl transferase AbiEii/AbiGii toxin family protein [Marinobacter antarcticus]HDZ37416.1 nucleotidyl transferase AbiEii/AbiGii toxin family protein [Marinobacter sp.]HEA53517.1 nucleotidyl transferase AbiEii/AbiGii toxin family protein [Marinobacter antarcticus]